MTFLTTRICAAVFLSSACFFLAVPLIPLYVASLDPGSSLAGPTIAVSFALSALLSPIWGALAERYGPKPMMVRAAMLVNGAYGLSALSTSVDALFVSRLVAGVASGFVPVATTALVRLSDTQRRATDMGWLSSAKSAGALLGPAVGGLLVYWTGSFRLAFFAAAVASLLTLLVTVTLPTIRPSETTGVEGIEDDSGRNNERPLILHALSITFVLNVGGVMIVVWLPFAMVAEYGPRTAASIVGFVTACAALASMVFAPLWGRFADSRQRGTALAATVLLPTPIVLALGLSRGTVFAAVFFILSSMLGSEAVALLGSEVSKELRRDKVGPYFGWSNSATQVASAAGAMLVPFLVATALSLPVWAALACYVVASLLTVLIVRTIRREPVGATV